MNAEQAVEQVRNTIFRPGWRFAAHAMGRESIWVDIAIETVNTSVVSPDGVYTQPMNLPSFRILHVGALDEASLAYKLVQLAHELDEHEDREFMRVRQPDGTWFAPLHPHRDDGDRAWDRNQMLDALTGRR